MEAKVADQRGGGGAAGAAGAVGGDDRAESDGGLSASSLGMGYTAGDGDVDGQVLGGSLPLLRSSAASQLVKPSGSMIGRSSGLMMGVGDSMMPTDESTRQSADSLRVADSIRVGEDLMRTSERVSDGAIRAGERPSPPPAAAVDTLVPGGCRPPSNNPTSSSAGLTTKGRRASRGQPTFDEILSGVKAASNVQKLRHGSLANDKASVANGDEQKGGPKSEAGTNGGVDVLDGGESMAAARQMVSDWSTLSTEEWSSLLRGARYKEYTEHQKVIRKGQTPAGLLQIVRGTVRVEVQHPGRPQAQVITRLGAGEILGEMSFLLGTPVNATCVCESADAAIIRLPSDYLRWLFPRKPSVAAKFHYLLAHKAAMRLRILYTSKQAAEFVFTGTDTSSKAAPRTIEAIFKVPAFAIIFEKFVRSSPERSERYGNVVALLQQVLALQTEGDPELVFQLYNSIFDSFIKIGAEHPIEWMFMPSKGHQTSTAQHGQRSAMKTMSILTTIRSKHVQHQLSIKVHSQQRLRAKEVRHSFDPLVPTAYQALESELLHKFVLSAHYEYILNLRLKESVLVNLDYFQVRRVLGQGAFGKVLEVTKRDSGKRYAMKVQSKKQLTDTFGELWEVVVSVERTILGQLHHPLLINLAYSFQNIDYLVLVMDLCEGGDLEVFGHAGPDKLTCEQLRFCGMEVLVAIAHLHKNRIMYRDLKPANLLLDAQGHTRLIDFGTAKLNRSSSARRPPKSSEECGTRGYMAPEVSMHAYV